MIKTIFIYLSFCLYIVLLPYNFCFAQSGNRQISLLHVAPQANQLPYPGAAMNLSVALVNTKDSQLVLKGFIVRDGKLIEITLSDVSQDQNERLVFSADIAAPLGELNYHFVLLGPKGVVASSKRFSVRRTCLPDVAGVDITIPEDIEMREKIVKLQSQASGLQDEVNNYEAVKKLLDQLRLLTES